MKNYSITNYNEYWYFNNDSEKIYTKLSAFEDEVELMANLLSQKIDDIPLKEIFDKELVEKDIVIL